MMIDIKDMSKIKETDKAVGIPFTHNGVTKMMWIPKSQIINQRGWKEQKFCDVPDWLYEKKVDELFL